MILHASNLTKTYGGLVAVNDVSFHIPDGKIFAIIGPNGAGKTTLFNLISGTQSPTSGEIQFEGTSITEKKPHEISLCGIRRTFQSTSIFGKLSVQENLLIGYIQETKGNYWGAILHTAEWKRHRAAAENKANEILDFLKMSDAANETASALSQEGQKRLAFGIALMSSPKLLLLDEPTSGLIQEDTDGIIEIIRKVNATGVTICLVEHKMNMVMSLADEILVLNFGKKIAQGPPGDICRDPEVVKAYLGREYADA